MIEQQFGIEIAPMWHGAPGNADSYTRDVRRELNKILRSRAGQYLAASLRYHHTHTSNKPILVMPYEGDEPNAQEDAVTKGSLQSVVLFTPVTKASRCSNGCAATFPHEVLFHELVHALRRVSRHMHRNLQKGQLNQYGNSEEFLAILVTNIFISDVTNHHKTVLRKDWVGHYPLDHEHADSFRFFSLGTRAFNIIANFCDDNRGFARMLSTVPAHFNPVAAYYKNAHKAFEMATKGDVEYVFNEMTPMDYYQRDDGAWVRTYPYDGVPGQKAGAQ